MAFRPTSHGSLFNCGNKITAGQKCAGVIKVSLISKLFALTQSVEDFVCAVQVSCLCKQACVQVGKAPVVAVIYAFKKFYAVGVFFLFVKGIGVPVNCGLFERVIAVIQILCGKFFAFLKVLRKPIISGQGQFEGSVVLSELFFLLNQ